LRGKGKLGWQGDSRSGLHGDHRVMIGIDDRSMIWGDDRVMIEQTIEWSSLGLSSDDLQDHRVMIWGDDRSMIYGRAYAAPAMPSKMAQMMAASS
jgi:hypothetical protein